VITTRKLSNIFVTLLEFEPLVRGCLPAVLLRLTGRAFEAWPVHARPLE
jgi:hypothetical protein